MVNVPRVKFYNGFNIPIVGLGTWNANPGEMEQAVKDAIDIGYRHIDCAYVYENEKEIGQAINNKIAEGVVKREDLFITTKLWNTFHRRDLVEVAIKKALIDLKVSYIDLFLIHWPMAYKEGEEIAPHDVNGKMEFSDVDYIETWQGMEDVVKKGYAKSVGLSNFNKRQIERVLAIASIKPVTNEIECHPYLNQRKLIDFCRSKDMTIIGYSPLGSPNRPWAKPGDPQLLEDIKLQELAAKYKKTPAQIVLRYQIDRGVIIIPKSVHKNRMKENFNIFDFQLTEQDVHYIDTFNCNGRVVPMASGSGHPYHPFESGDEY